MKVPPVRFHLASGAALVLAIQVSGCSVLSPSQPLPPDAVELAGGGAPVPIVVPSVDLSPTQVPVQTPDTAGLIARLNWQDEFGESTIVFETPGETVKLRQVGYGSLMLKFGETVVHVNPWSEAADYSVLPKADQIWITDASPEHLDLHAIRQISKDDTQVIANVGSTFDLEGLVLFVPLRSDSPIIVDDVRLEAIPSFRAELWPDGPRVVGGNSYLASFGDFTLFLASEAHFIPGASALGKVDVALVTLGEESSLSPQQAAEIARSLEPTILLPYQYRSDDPTILGQLLAGSGTMVIPLNSADPNKPRPPMAVPTRRFTPTQDDFYASRPDFLEALFAAPEDLNLPLLPDLRTLPPTGLRITHLSSQDVTQLRLTNSVWNGGYGPLDLVGVQDRGSGTHYVIQRVLRENGEYVESSVGEFLFHTGHNHWHLDSFALYELWSLRSDGMLDQVVAASDKVSYCLRDISRSSAAWEVSRAGFTSCSPTRQGISIGWTDVYQYYLAGQSIDITGVPDGTYALRSTADPENLIHESDETNNSELVYVEINGRKLTVVERPLTTIEHPE